MMDYSRGEPEPAGPMDGNPHAAMASARHTALAVIEDIGFDQAKVQIAMLQAEATLALAYEQRTANLIAYWDTMTESGEPAQENDFQREMDKTHLEIRSRMGLNEWTPGT